MGAEDILGNSDGNADGNTDGNTDGSTDGEDDGKLEGITGTTITSGTALSVLVALGALLPPEDLEALGALLLPEDLDFDPDLGM